MIILAIDPGATSGIAIVGNGAPSVCEMGDVMARKHRFEAMEILAGLPADTRCVIEDVGYLSPGLHWQTLAGIGKRIGAWWTLCAMRFGKDPVMVHPHVWQAARLGRGRRAGLKELSLALAKRSLGFVPGENAADAWNLAEWAAVDWKVWRRT
jgi:hypothetical protein